MVAAVLFFYFLVFVCNRIVQLCTAFSAECKLILFIELHAAAWANPLALHLLQFQTHALDSPLSVINIRTEFLQFCKFLFLALIIEFANFLHHFLNPFPFVCNLFPQIADFRSVLRHSRNAAAHLFKNICHCHRPLSFVNFMMFQL